MATTKARRVFPVWECQSVLPLQKPLSLVEIIVHGLFAVVIGIAADCTSIFPTGMLARRVQNGTEQRIERIVIVVTAGGFVVFAVVVGCRTGPTGVGPVEKALQTRITAELGIVEKHHTARGRGLFTIGPRGRHLFAVGGVAGGSRAQKLIEIVGILLPR